MEVLWCEDKWQPLLPNGGFVEGFHNWLVMSSIMGPSLGSKLPRTILLMEVAMVSRYTDPVELSQTILLALMLEILGVILPTAAMLVEVPQPSRAGSSILMCRSWCQQETQGGVEGHTTHQYSGGGKCWHCGSPWWADEVARLGPCEGMGGPCPTVLASHFVGESQWWLVLSLVSQLGDPAPG